MSIKNRQFDSEILIANDETETTTIQSGWFDVSGYHNMLLLIDVTAVAGTNPTLDITVETPGKLKSVQFTIDTVPTISAVGKTVQFVDVRGVHWIRLNYTIGGTTPSFTFDIIGTAE